MFYICLPACHCHYSSSLLEAGYLYVHVYVCTHIAFIFGHGSLYMYFVPKEVDGQMNRSSSVRSIRAEGAGNK